jgi:DNA-directed RNA polymerase specialized sigma subunit
MKIPPNMTRQQVIDKIQLVVNRISPKYIFQGYEVDDIKQEAFIICMNALERYKPEIGPLENFLSINLSNRLKNFIRDNFYKKDDLEKKKIMSPVPLSFDQISHEDNNILNFPLKELSDLVDKNLPIDYRADYLKLMNNISISKKRKLEIIDLIKKIAQEHGYDEAW